MWNWLKKPTPRWATLLFFLLLALWQYCTWRYLRDELTVWIENYGGDGPIVPKPPPKI